MSMQYNLTNIRNLLTQGFTDEDLRRLCYDSSDLRPVYDQLARNSGKAKIIDDLIEHADRMEQVGKLLTLAKEHNPIKYEKYQPYWDGIFGSPIPDNSSSYKRVEDVEFKLTTPNKALITDNGLANVNIAEQSIDGTTIVDPIQVNGCGNVIMKGFIPFLDKAKLFL